MDQGERVPARDADVALALAALKAGVFYARWYPRLFFPKASRGQNAGSNMHPCLRRHLRFVERTGRKLARSLFQSMVRCGPKLEREQLLLGRFVDIAAEIFAMSVTCARAHASMNQEKELLELADCFCRGARCRVTALFRALNDNPDRANYRLAQKLLSSPPMAPRVQTIESVARS